MTVLQLPENYRCPPEVIDLANSLLAHNTSHSADKQILKARKQANREEPIRLRAFQSFSDEAEWIASDIARRDLPTRALCVVLARARKLLEEILGKLTEKGVSAYLAVRKDEWTSVPMQLLHAWLRLANARQDRDQLRRVCKSFYAVEGIDLEVKDIISAAATYEGDYLRTFAIVALSRTELESATRVFVGQSLLKLADCLNHRAFVTDCFAWFDHLVDAQVTPGDASSNLRRWSETFKKRTNITLA